MLLILEHAWIDKGLFANGHQLAELPGRRGAATPFYEQIQY
jgi:hypothetical protein